MGQNGPPATMNGGLTLGLNMTRLSITSAVVVGTLWVNVPVLPLMFAPLAAFLYIGPRYASQPSTSFIVIAMPALLLFGFVIAWFWWAYMVPRWRVWAWQRVEDLGGLRARAVRAGLIWPRGHLLEKTEIRPRPVKEKLRNLEAKERHSA